MTDPRRVIDDLAEEAAAFDALFADIDSEQWRAPTPAEGWTVTDQVGHLAFVFTLAGLATAEPEKFTAITSPIGNAPGNFDRAVNDALADYVNDPTEVLVRRWREARDFAIKALTAQPADAIVPWLVNPLPPAVLACAGMMELFAHGQDIADALGVRPQRTDRIGNIVGFAVRAWEFGYQARGLTPPAEPFRFELVSPSGALWTFGDEAASDRISGSANDFCLLVTRRRHRDDLTLSAEGAEANAWLDIAQAYRGPSGKGRRPGQFS
jgi:uncharacterized protein (TIGR03084 family)